MRNTKSRTIRWIRNVLLASLLSPFLALGTMLILISEPFRLDCGEELSVEASGRRIAVEFCGAFPPDNACKAVRKGAISRIKLPSGKVVEVQDWVSRHERMGDQLRFIGHCSGKSVRYNVRSGKLTL